MIKKSVCPYDCPAACSLEINLENDRVMEVKGDPDHPIFQGLICQKMRHYEKGIYSNERILTPLKRTGQKGEGLFTPVSWETAIKDITDRWKEIIKTHGPDGMLGLSSSGTLGLIQKFCVDAFFHRMGGRITLKTLCSGAKSAAYQSCMGGRGALCPSECETSDYYILWGMNAKATLIHTLAMLERQRTLGKKVILIESCAVDMASHVDEVILIKPGSDGALGLAIMHVLDQEGYIPEEAITEFATGFREFKESLDQYSPEWAEEITGMNADKIRQIAREYGQAKAPVIMQGTGLSRRGNGGMNTRIIMTLAMITGAWRYPGGGYVGRNPAGDKTVDLNLVSRPDFRKYHGKIENITLLADVISSDNKKKNAVYGLFLSGSNPVNSCHDQKKMMEALRRDDLFTVVHERVMTDTAKYADYILPATYHLEHTDCYNSGMYCSFGSTWQMLKPQGQCKSNWDTMALLAQAMGYEEDYFKKSDQDMLRKLLENPGPALKNLTIEEWDILYHGGAVKIPYSDHSHFPTSDGKFHIMDQNEVYPIPCYVEDFQDHWPLCLIAIPNVHTLNSVFFDRKELLERRGKARLWMHPEDAELRSIETGDIVFLENDMAKVEITAEITSLIARGCVAVSGSYGLQHTGLKLQINALHHCRVSDMGQATTLNGNRVEVRKITMEE